MPRTALPLLALLAAGPGLAHADARCEVWQRELGFAHAVATHQAKAVRDFVTPHTVFAANTLHPVHGREAFAKAWAPLVAGKDLSLRWYPDQVVVSVDDPDVAYSSGPYLMRPHGARRTAPSSIGRFATVWHRGADGLWRVLFDGGEAGHPADAKAVAAFTAGRRDTCPDGHESPTPGR